MSAYRVCDNWLLIGRSAKGDGTAASDACAGLLRDMSAAIGVVAVVDVVVVMVPH